ASRPPFFKERCMATEPMDPFFFETPATAPRTELQVSALLHLMSQYTVRAQENSACVKLAAIIERHLTAPAALPELSPVLQSTCRDLAEQWTMVVERTLPATNPRRTFGRLSMVHP